MSRFAHNLEGVVAKPADSIYEAGRRRTAWQKPPLKPKQDHVPRSGFPTWGIRIVAGLGSQFLALRDDKPPYQVSRES